jgi:2-octaprenylphenol hydroxylase
MSAARIVVAGGGPVGLALACACEGFDVRVIEASKAARVARTDAYDIRVYAVSPGNRDFLRAIGAWERLDAARVAPVRRMEVFGDAGGELGFAARATSALAWIVEAGRLGDAIEAAAAARTRIALARGAQAVAFGVGGARPSGTGSNAPTAWAELEGGERIEGDLLVGADGPDSRVRTAFGFRVRETPYGEAAVVANFDTERTHGDTARQWFRADGVLAWLPLPGERISIVWSTPASHAEELVALDARALERRVREAGGAVLGDLKLISSVARFPLRSIRVPAPVMRGVALVGDAAHTIHPLAGQGVNLGFQDARVLAEVLGTRSALERPGDWSVLRRYARSRAEEVGAMQFMTHGLDRLFALQGEPLKRLRNAGMRLVDAQPWIKAVLGGRAMR